MDKSPDAFRTISEAADELDLPQHVLRFWETRFATIRPLKRGGGRRYYRPEDVLLLKGIRYLLYDRGFTIKGVQKILKDHGSRYVIGIGEGRPIESLPAPEPDFGPEDLGEPEVEFDTEGEGQSASVGAGLQAPTRGLFGLRPKQAGTGLTQRDRDRLNDVLRDLLDAKRLLDRAREN